MFILHSFCTLILPSEIPSGGAPRVASTTLVGRVAVLPAPRATAGGAVVHRRGRGRHSGLAASLLLPPSRQPLLGDLSQLGADLWCPLSCLCCAKIKERRLRKLQRLLMIIINQLTWSTCERKHQSACKFEQAVLDGARGPSLYTCMSTIYFMA
ncbi:uncharacterized protein LOC116542595 [Sapajus apella]|uniref:Uncharacterized protein LOC116542595 n=1 Tax=Sapajus apella TaxID=9515 RepID=A0A6J3H0T6_SAPAP|nr:uncharacterized protein LOC116542595 [Sapajus apella]